MFGARKLRIEIQVSDCCDVFKTGYYAESRSASEIMSLRGLFQDRSGSNVGRKSVSKHGVELINTESFHSFRKEGTTSERNRQTKFQTKVRGVYLFRRKQKLSDWEQRVLSNAKFTFPELRETSRFPEADASLEPHSERVDRPTDRQTSTGTGTTGQTRLNVIRMTDGSLTDCRIRLRLC